MYLFSQFESVDIFHVYTGNVSLFFEKFTYNFLKNSGWEHISDLGIEHVFRYK